jgi:hypothetical protein
MADTFWGWNIGGGAAGGDGVTKDTSTTSKKIELRVETAVTGMKKTEILKGLEAIKAYIIENDFTG